MSLKSKFEAFWDRPANDRLLVHVPDYAVYYGKKKDIPLIKDKCSYCGLNIEFPYPQHEECIKIQIEVEKNAIR